MDIPMKKIVAMAAAALLAVTLAAPTLAESQSVAAYQVVRGENFCTGTFDSVPLGALPQKGDNKALSSTQGWRSNEYDHATVSVVESGYKGGRCLQIQGNGTNAYGAAYFILPTGNIKRRETYEVSFMYKVTDPLLKTNQLHCDVMDGGVGETHTIIAGLAPLPGDDVGDGWRRVSGTFVAETPGNFKAIRFFAEFVYGGSNLGSEASLLVDNVEIYKLGVKAGSKESVNLSSANLVAGGDFEYKDVNSRYDPNFDDHLWWTVQDEKMASTVVSDDGSKALKISGNMMLKYGSVFVNFQEKMTPGKTYRLMFDYKFLGSTKKDTTQAHVAFMADGDMQIGNPGGWSNVNLVLNDLGDSLSNGYKRVAVDFTPTAFQAQAISGLRFFVGLAMQASDFGIMFDNVRVSEVTGGGTPEPTSPTQKPTTPSNSGNDNPGNDTPGPADPTDGEDPGDVTDPSQDVTGDTTDATGADGETTVETLEVGGATTAPDDGDASSGGSRWWIPVVIVAGILALGGGGFALWYFVIRPKMMNKG